MDNKYIRDPSSLALMESNLAALNQSRIRRKIFKIKDNKIHELETQIHELNNKFDQLTNLVDGIIKNGTTGK